MKRRSVLQALGTLATAPLWMQLSALAQSGKSKKITSTIPAAPKTPVTKEGAELVRVGLPADWKFELPKQWKSDGGMLTKGQAAQRQGGGLVVSGVTAESKGKEVRFGSLRPLGQAVELTPEMRKVVGSASSRLKLDVLNQTYNSFRTNPQDLTRKPLVGPYKSPEQIFLGNAFVPVRRIMTAALAQVGPGGDAAKALLPALNEMVDLVTPAHVFALPEGVGNRVVAYSTQGSGIEHTHIDQLMHELRKQHMRVVKTMTLFKFFKDKENPNAPTSYSQGGTLKEILSDSVGATWHTGGYSAGYDETGKPITVKSDWPTDYGALTDTQYSEYNAHLVAIDYQGGARRPIPGETLAAYYRNADIWDCAAAITVPFVDQDKDPIYREYYYNPLEGYDRRTLQRVANNLAKLSREEFLKQHGAFYCSEGQFTVANLGPQEYSLVKKRVFGNTPLGRLIDTYNAAPGYKGKSVEERRRSPIIGWNYLKELGPEKGGINEEQFEHLDETERTAVYLEWIPEDVRGWQTYGLREKEGLIARPMTVATMAWSLLRRYMPREGVANVISADIMRAYTGGTPAVKKAVVALCGGAAPDTEEGQLALANIAMRAATGTLIGLLASAEIKHLLLLKGGYAEVLTSWDKSKVQKAYDGFLDILREADYSSQESLDAALLAADEELSNLKVWRRHYNKKINFAYPWRQTLMKYAAPVCFVSWAQQPFMARTGCIRYVATAMHTKQAKTTG
jgi:hypothetical protein